MSEYSAVDVTSGAFTQVVVKKGGAVVERSKPMEITGSKKHIAIRKALEAKYIMKSLSLNDVTF